MENNQPGGTYTPPPPAPPPAGPGGDLIYPSAPAKEPVLILLLNVFLAGVGYFILGQWQKGIAALAAAVIIGLPTCGFGAVAVCIAAAIDGFNQAQQLQAGFPIAQWTFFKDHR